MAAARLAEHYAIQRRKTATELLRGPLLSDLLSEGGHVPIDRDAEAERVLKVAEATQVQESAPGRLVMWRTWRQRFTAFECRDPGRTRLGRGTSGSRVSWGRGPSPPWRALTSSLHWRIVAIKPGGPLTSNRRGK